MLWTISIKRALSDYGPIRKNGVYIVYDMKHFLRVEITDFNKSKHIDVKHDEVMFEDFRLDTFDNQKALSMLRGEEYYPEYSNVSAYAHLPIKRFNYSVKDFIDLIDSFGEEIRKEQAFAIGNLNDLYLGVTKEGLIASDEIFNFTDPNIDKIETKISAMFLAICLYFDKDRTGVLKTSEIKEELYRSIELSEIGEHKGFKIPTLFRLAREMIKMEHEAFLAEADIIEKIMNEEAKITDLLDEEEECKA